MRILLVSDYYPPILGGIATLVQSLSEALVDRGHKVLVYAVAGPRRTEKNGIITKRAMQIGSFFPFMFKQIEEPNIAPMPDPLFIKGLKQIVARFKPDIIHAHGWVMFPTSFYKKLNPDVAAIATLHDYGFFCAKRDLIPELDKRRTPMVCQRTNVGNECVRCSSKTYGFLKSLGVVLCIQLFSPLLNELNCLTAVSNCVAEKARNRVKTKLSVVPNFINLKRFSSKTPDEKPKCVADILFVGRLTPAKGVHLLIKAFEILRKSVPKAKLCIIGKKDPYYNVKIAEKSVSQYEGVSNSELMSLYRHAKIVVVPSVWADPAPLVTLEAMAFGKPLVVTNVGGLKDIVIHGKTGLIVEPRPDNLADALEFLLSDKGVCLEMGAKTKIHLSENFSSRTIVPMYEKVYDEAIRLGKQR